MSLREIRIRKGAEPHDVAYKNRLVQRYLAAGDDVRVVYVLRAREGTRATVEYLLADLAALAVRLDAEVVEPPRNTMRSVQTTIRRKGTPPPEQAGARVPLAPLPPALPGSIALPQPTPQQVP